MPPRDPEIFRMIKKAERMKAREAKETEKEERRDRPREFPPLDIESMRAYRALYPHPPTVIWLFSFLIALAGLIAALMENLFPNDRLIFGSLTALFVAYGFIKSMIIPIFWYFIHRDWRKRLPFTLNGWAEFGSTSHILNSWEWRDLSIKIDTQTSSPDFTAALDAIVTILFRDIENVTYTEDAGEPPRQEWTWDAKKREMTGSANSQVLGLLLDFFRGPMTHVVNTFNASMTITITPDGDWYHVTGEPMGQTVG